MHWRKNWQQMVRVNEMLTIVMKVNSRNVIGVKETLAAYCERFGDVVFVEIKEEDPPEQMKLG